MTQNDTCSQVKVLFYWLVANKLAAFVAHTFGLRSVNFQENHSNGSRDRTENAHWSASNVPLIIDQSQQNLRRL